MDNKNKKSRLKSMGARTAAAVLAAGILAGCSGGGTATSATSSSQAGSTMAGISGPQGSTQAGMPGTTGVTGRITSPQTGGMVSAREARQAVTDRFQGIIQKIEYNYDDTNPLYKGEALKQDMKVVFEMSAVSGEFEKWDEENDSSYNEFAHALPELITVDEAADSVIARSGKPNTFVQKIDFLWDDSEPMYQGEAFNEGMKYSFEIDAQSGEFHKWDADEDDDTWAEQYSNVQ